MKRILFLAVLMLARVGAAQVIQPANGSTPGGTAGGDLSGTYPNPTVVNLNGTSLSGLSTGLLRNTTSTGVPSSAELSGDATTSGSNAVTVVKVNGASVPASIAPVTNSSSQLVQGAWKLTPASGTITQYSITANVITLTMANTFATGGGSCIVMAGFGTSTFLNNFQVCATSATSTTFVGPFFHANASATEAGTYSQSLPVENTGVTATKNYMWIQQIPAGTMGINSKLLIDSSWSACSATNTPFPYCGQLLTVTGVSGGSGFSGSGTIFLTAFNNSCSGATATVTLSSGAFSSAVVTYGGSGCTAAPTQATCTSGTATCTGSPVSITVTSTVQGVNTGTCHVIVNFSASSGSGGLSVVDGGSVTAGHGTNVTGKIVNLGSLSSQVMDGFGVTNASTANSGLSALNTVNTANASYVAFTVQNSVAADQCYLTNASIQLIP